MIVNDICLLKFSSSTLWAAIVAPCNRSIEFLNAAEPGCLSAILAEEREREEVKFNACRFDQHEIARNPVPRESLHAISKSGFGVPMDSIHQSSHVNFVNLPPSDSLHLANYMPV